MRLTDVAPVVAPGTAIGIVHTYATRTAERLLAGDVACDQPFGSFEEAVVAARAATLGAARGAVFIANGPAGFILQSVTATDAAGAPAGAWAFEDRSGAMLPSMVGGGFAGVIWGIVDGAQLLRAGTGWG